MTLNGAKAGTPSEAWGTEMSPEAPQLATLALMVRSDGKTLLVRHAAGPFAGRWSAPFIGVGDVETAEDALERLLRDFLHVDPGPYEFLDTIYLTGDNGERFIANSFTCVNWLGDPRFPGQIFSDALWVAAADVNGLEMLPEMREWLAGVLVDDDSVPAPVSHTADAVLAELASARGTFLAAYDALPHGLRAEALDEGGWCALDALAHAIDVEAYYRSEVRRCLEEPGRVWRPFNDKQWEDVRRLRPSEEEAVLRERMDAVRAETRSWITYQPPGVLDAYLDHPSRGVVQVGEQLLAIARHDRSHAGQLDGMAAAARLRAAAENADPDADREDPQ